MLKPLALLLIVMSSPASAADYPATDQSGNVYPEACRRDLSDVPATVIRGDLGAAGGRKRLGLWSPSAGVLPDLIMISDRLGGWKYDDALQHEKCHAHMNKLYPETKGQWHP